MQVNVWPRYATDGEGALAADASEKKAGASGGVPVCLYYICACTQFSRWSASTLVFGFILCCLEFNNRAKKRNESRRTDDRLTNETNESTDDTNEFDPG